MPTWSASRRARQVRDRARTLNAITGGRVVMPAGVLEADVILRDGLIEELAVPGSASGELLDAGGCYVLPGGVDPHCHIMSDIRSAASAAALGGTTTVLSFTNPEPGEGALAGLLRRREEVSAAQPAVDVGLHAMLAEPDQVSFDELAAIRRAGAVGVKVFLAYRELGIMCSTQRLFQLMNWTRELGLVMQVHCENGALIDALVGEALQAGRRGPSTFAETRPPEVEEEAVARVLATAALTGAPSYLVHLSCSRALSQVRLARGRRHPPVFAEVCLHHLLLDERHHERPDAERFLVCPPLREATECEALWEGIVDGTVDIVASDHAQLRSRTPEELSLDGVSHGYGLAGIGPRLPLFLSEGRARGVPIRRLVELASTRASRVFGHPGKGEIAPGADA
ncbi:MAG TPA: amidohydrolase family protein, partial [Acidimicrobiales bacterium]|nr:amidohydrolase family protein [Acidimicrobiales bacterium]